ncbi:hypothetical protein HKX48_009109 [Thoreauomyces humboldtii]|nr:hypothetical protein HKX48_009109 [Thoreauomyces humboldtii]
MASSSQVDVLIVGAGPVGLFSALCLDRMGVTVRIVDKAAEQSPHSKAFGMQVRTQEILEQFGLLETFEEHMNRTGGYEFFSGTKPPWTLSLTADIREETCRDTLAIIPQNETERLFTEALSARGIHVHRGVALQKYHVDPSVVGTTDPAVVAVLDSGETVRCSYLVGADGGHSLVRKGLGLKLEGAEVPGYFALADGVVDTDMPIKTFNALFMKEGSCFVSSLTDGLTRVILHLPDGNDDQRANEYHGLTDESLTLDEVNDRMRRLIAPYTFTMTEPRWLVKAHFQERIADTYNRDDLRVFLAGDAGHVHSPAGGQGMNLGIQDAYALTWRIAAVLKRGGDATALLSSYTPERRSVAKGVLDFSGRLHRFFFGRGWMDWITRTVFLNAAYYLPFVRSRFANTGKGFMIQYPTDSVLIQPTLKDVPCTARPGFRAPNGAIHRSGSRILLHSLFQPGLFTVVTFLANPGPVGDATWPSSLHRGVFTQVVVVRASSVDKEDAYVDEGAVFPAYGVDGNAVVVVRPDGYVGMVARVGGGEMGWERVEGYFDALFQ